MKCFPPFSAFLALLISPVMLTMSNTGLFLKYKGQNDSTGRLCSVSFPKNMDSIATVRAIFKVFERGKLQIAQRQKGSVQKQFV